MKMISTHEAAKQLGIHFTTLAHYVAVGKLPAPAIIEAGSRTVHAWTPEQVEQARTLLPKIANGRKTRYQKLREKQKTQPRAPQPHHAKTTRAGGPWAALPKKRGTKKKK